MKKYITQHVIVAAFIGLIIGGAAGYFGEMQFSGRAGRFGGGTLTQAGSRGPGGMRGGGFTAGEVIAKDATSLTVKAPDGSSKIVLVSASSQVTHSAPGTLDDVAIGTNILVTGTVNSDQSVTAQTIQVRPAGQQGPGNRQ